MVSKNKKPTFLSASGYILLFLAVGSWFSIFLNEGGSISELFSEKTLQFTKDFLVGLFVVKEGTPAFLNKESWENALYLTIETLQMSVMATGFAAATAIVMVVPSARNVADGSLTLSSKWHGWISYSIIRVGYIFSRAVPELVWAMMIIFIFKPGILPGAIALAIHNFGILGKLCAEVIEDFDSRPSQNLAACGAGRIQILFYCILPAALPRFLTYTLYRWEMIMRTTIVVGFVGAGGLGQQFKLSMSFFHYTDITLLLGCYLLLVFAADYISEKSRKFIK